MLRRLYDRTLALAAHRRAMPALAVVGFLEASVFPIPTEVLMIPMVLAERRKAWRIAALATIASTLGGAAGFAIGLLLFATVGRAILELYGLAAQFAEAQAQYREWGVWIVAAGAVTPLPYKVVTIASGAARLDFGLFLVVSLIARAARYYAVVAVLWYFGPPVRRLVERNLGFATAGFFALLFGGFLVVRYGF